MLTSLHILGQNRLLALLSRAERERVIAQCERMRLDHRTVVYKAGADIEDAYFPLSGMVSLVISSKDGETVEVGTVGNEGMVGTPLVLGARRSPVEAVVQVGGELLRISRRDLEREVGKDGKLRTVAQRFAQALTNQVAQSVLCNGVHRVEQRLCRWFLKTHDRAGNGSITLTQQFVAQMLGVRRASVTDAVGALQKAGLITYSRGRLDILDRRGLEAGSCECYMLMRQEMERLLTA